MFRRACLLLLLITLPTAVVLLASGCDYGGDEPAAAANGEVVDLPPTETSASGHPKLSSKLNRLISANEQGEAEEFARPRGIELVDGSVQIIIECEPGEVEAAAVAAGALGTVELTTGTLVQAVVPITSLTALALAESIRFIRLPSRSVPEASNQDKGLASG